MNLAEFSLGSSGAVILCSGEHWRAGGNSVEDGPSNVVPDDVFSVRC